MIDCAYNNLIDLKDHCLLCYRTTSSVIANKRRDVVHHRKNSDLENNANNGITAAGELEGEEAENNGIRTELEEEDDEEEEEEDINIDVEKLSEDDEEEKLPPPPSCKLFLKLLSRYLQLPSAVLTIVLGGDDSGPKIIRKRWENLITGTMCNTCHDMVQPFCDLFRQYEYVKTQMDLRLQDIEQSIHLTERESTCQAGRTLLKRKWEMDGVDSKHSFELLKMLRADILSQVTKKNNFPVVRLERIRTPDPGAIHFHHEDADEDCAFSISEEMINKEHRPSITDDSGVSSNSASSPHSSVSYEEIEGQFINGDPTSQQSVNLDTSSCNNGNKEYKVMRQIIRCKKCDKKIVGKQRFQEHCETVHPKSTLQTQTSSSLSSPSNSGVRSKSNFRIKKTVIICPEKDCSAKFLRKELFLEHLEGNHPELVANYSDTASRQIDPTSDSEIVPETNGQENQSMEQDSNEQAVGNIENIPNERRQTCRAIYRKRNHHCPEKTCDRKFHTPEELFVHSQGHRKHQCNFCHRICKNPGSTALHEVGKHGDFQGHTWKDRPFPFKCPRCLEIFCNINTYKAHFWRSHLNTLSSSFKCFECKSIFTSPRTFQVHVKKCKRLAKIIAESDKDFKEDDQIPIVKVPIPGAKTGTDNTMTICSICNLQCNSSYALRHHIIASHDADMLFCPDCPRFFKSRASLENHRQQIHTPNSPQPSIMKLLIIRKFCKYCNSRKTFKSLKAFNAHLSQHEIGLSKKKGLRECPVCEKTFQNLGSHLRSHTHHQRQESDNAKGSKQIETNNSAESESSRRSSINVQPQTPPPDNELQHGESSNVEFRIKNLADRVKLRRRSVQTPLVDFSDNSSDEGKKRKRGEKRRRIMRKTDTRPMEKRTIRKMGTRRRPMAKRRRKRGNNIRPVEKRHKRKTDDKDTTEPLAHKSKQSKLITATNSVSTGNEQQQQQDESTQREEKANNQPSNSDGNRLPLKKRQPPPPPIISNWYDEEIRATSRNHSSNPIFLDNGSQTDILNRNLNLSSNIAADNTQSENQRKDECEQTTPLSKPKTEHDVCTPPAVVNERLQKWMAAGEKNNLFDLGQSDNQTLADKPQASETNEDDDDDCVIIEEEKPEPQPDAQSNLKQRVNTFLSRRQGTFDIPPDEPIIVNSPSSPDIIILD